SLRLLRHHLADGASDASGERCGVDRDAFFLGKHRADEILGPRQAAGMRGKESLAAALHKNSPGCRQFQARDLGGQDMVNECLKPRAYPSVLLSRRVKAPPLFLCAGAAVAAAGRAGRRWTKTRSDFSDWC